MVVAQTYAKTESDQPKQRRSFEFYLCNPEPRMTMNAKKCFRTTYLGVAILGTAVSGACLAQQPDNTAANKNNTPSADQQKNDSADRDLAKQIRKSITDDKSLSTYAHNVKVIVRNGDVTLKGPVQSDDEKATVESKATSLAGSGKVHNELTVKNGAN
jgi:hyperosmotically inducible periplasmic protein